MYHVIVNFHVLLNVPIHMNVLLALLIVQICYHALLWCTAMRKAGLDAWM